MACDFELPPRIKLDHAGTSSAENSSESRGQPVGANTGKKGPSPFLNTARAARQQALLLTFPRNHRPAVVRSGASWLPGWLEKAWQGQLAWHLQVVCTQQNSYSSCQSRSKALPTAEWCDEKAIKIQHSRPGGRCPPGRAAAAYSSTTLF